MAQANVELVRDIFETVGQRGDVHAALVTMTPDVEWDMSGVVGWPEERSYRGREAVREFLEGWIASWGEWHFDIQEIAEQGNRVFVAIREWGLGVDSGASVEQRRFFAWRLEDGRTVRVQMFSERSDALEAVGFVE
jgi:ketosteroid isomerase-like protein